MIQDGLDAYRKKKEKAQAAALSGPIFLTLNMVFITE
jgi:hypothetical protein